MAKKKETEVKEAVVAEEKTEVKEEEKALNPTLQKKKENREAKAARKAKNQVEEKKKRPNNVVIFILIFVVVFGMFAFIWGYNYYHKEASIQSYIKNNGGKEAFSNMDMGDGSTLSVTAKKNDMTVVLNIKSDDKTAIKEAKEYYKSDEGKEWVEYIAAYYLSTIKPETRAFTAKAEVQVKINGDVYKTYEVKYRDADDIVEEYTQKMQSQAAE